MAIDQETYQAENKFGFWVQFKLVWFVISKYFVMLRGKVIYPKYSKHWPYTVAHTIDFVCSKSLNHGLNHGLFLSFFKLIVPAPYIELYMC